MQTIVPVAIKLNRELWHHTVSNFYNVCAEDRDTEDIVTTKFETLLHMRHDFLHILVCEVLHINGILGTGGKISEVLSGIYFPKELERLTPDIVYKSFDKIIMIDVTISIDPEKQRFHKIEKYSRITKYLETLGMTCTLIIIACLPDFTNLDQEMMQIAMLTTTDYRVYLWEFQNIITDIQGEIEKTKAMLPDEYSREVNTELPHYRCEFKDVSEYESIYKESDLGKAYTNRPKLTQDQAYNEFIKLYDDPEVQHTLKDKTHTQGSFINAFEKLDEMEPEHTCTAKPSHHILYVPYEDFSNVVSQELNIDTSEFKIDQIHMLKFLHLISIMKTTDPAILLLHHIFNDMVKALQDPVEVRLFNTGFFTGTYEGDREKKEQFATANEIHLSKIPFISMRGKAYDDAKTDKPYFERSHQICCTPFKADVKEFVHKSGVRYNVHHNNTRIYTPPMSCHKHSSDDVDKFLNLLVSDSGRKLQIDPLWKLPIGKDSSTAEKLKAKFRSEYKDFYKLFHKTHAMHASYHASIVADQAIHFCSMNTKEYSFSVVNSGLPNVLHVFHGGRTDRAADVGCPFFSVALTTNKQWVNSVYGHIRSIDFPAYTKDGRKIYILVTNWRRLQIHKLCLLRDQFYTCLSTSFDTYQRNKDLRGQSITEYKKFVYGVKVLVANCTSQRVSEFLMDTRYVIMACFSDFTNVTALISDKFAPHYPNSLCRWIVKQLKNKVLTISEEFKNNETFTTSTPVFHKNKRLQQSLGGQIKFSSIWTNYTLCHIQDLFDELFIYVLTGKEPSSTFSEGVKSLKTILKFQREYDSLSPNIKMGLHTRDSFKDFILSKKQVGFWYDLVVASTEHTMENLKGKKVKSLIDKNTCQEVLSDIESTKACIPEYNLTTRHIKSKEGELTEAKKRKKEEKEKQKEQNIYEHLIDSGMDVIEMFNYIDREFESVHIESVVHKTSKTLRAKVHDLCHDFSLRYPDEAQNVLSVAHWNMFKNKNLVQADICIKAQYGAKREFYVVNFGAKCMVRIYENLFKSVASFLPEEMISVPGDRKMEFMFKNMNHVLTARKDFGDTIYYVNGDCTKWSACETMGSFWALTEGMANVFTKEQIAFCKVLLSGWSNKNINIPIEILKGTKFITEKTDYLQTGCAIQSTQNFLQGMFNYSSSVKAVCATNFAVKCWNRKFGERRPIVVTHLEHSDDYSLIVRVQCTQDFVDFRIMHRLSQKIHGINDSDKKTNCQRFIMEFISLMSFNGLMAYPTIKKTKEVGINIAGTGYQKDAMNIASRAGEALRLGVPMVSAYVVQMLQGINIFRKYSLGKNQRNETIISSDPYNYPIELFGLPDCLPLFYVGTVGDPNNFRLYRYCDNAKKLIEGLYVDTVKNFQHVTDADLTNMMATFITPKYKYSKQGNKLRWIRRKLGWTEDKITNYIENNPEYLIMKPRNKENYKEWLEYQYYNQSFSTAYTTASRKNIMLRLSFFSSGKCIYTSLEDDELSIETISVYCDFLFKRYENLSLEYNAFEDKTSLNRLLTNSDPTIQSYFELLEGATCFEIDVKPTQPMVTKLPSTYKYIKFENHLQNVIQYSINKEKILNNIENNFEKDRRVHKGIASLNRDVNKIIEYFGDIRDSKTILQLNKVLNSQTRNQPTALCFSADAGLSPLENLLGYIESGCYYDKQNKFIPKKVFKLMHPITQQVLFTRDFQFSGNVHSLLLENLTQVFYLLKVKFALTDEQILQIINDIEVPMLSRKLVEELNNALYDLTNIGDIFHKRMYVFFDRFINRRLTNLIEFTHSEYNVRHDFLNDIDRAEFNSQGFISDDVAAFTFRHTNFLALRLKQNNDILIISQQGNYTKNIIAYQIGRCLFRLISQSKFEELVLTSPSTDIPVIDHDYIKRFIKSKNKIAKTFRYFQKDNNIITETKVVTNVLPIIKTNNPLLVRRKSSLNMPLHPDIDTESCSVKSDKTTLFTLPLSPCGPTFLLKLPSYKLNNFVCLSEFNTERLLYNYLLEKSDMIKFDKEKIISYLDFFNEPIQLERFGLPPILDLKSKQEFPPLKDNRTLLEKYTFDYHRIKVFDPEEGFNIEEALKEQEPNMEDQSIEPILEKEPSFNFNFSAFKFDINKEIDERPVIVEEKNNNEVILTLNELIPETVYCNAIKSDDDKIVFPIDVIPTEDGLDVWILAEPNDKLATFDELMELADIGAAFNVLEPFVSNPPWAKLMAGITDTHSFIVDTTILTNTVLVKLEQSNLFCTIKQYEYSTICVIGVDGDDPIVDMLQILENNYVCMDVSLFEDSFIKLIDFLKGNDIDTLRLERVQSGELMLYTTGGFIKSKELLSSKMLTNERIQLVHNELSDIDMFLSKQLEQNNSVLNNPTFLQVLEYVTYKKQGDKQLAQGTIINLNNTCILDLTTSEILNIFDIPNIDILIYKNSPRNNPIVGAIDTDIMDYLIPTFFNVDQILLDFLHDKSVKLELVDFQLDNKKIYITSPIGTALPDLGDDIIMIVNKELYLPVPDDVSYLASVMPHKELINSSFLLLKESDNNLSIFFDNNICFISDEGDASLQEVIRQLTENQCTFILSNQGLLRDINKCQQLLAGYKMTDFEPGFYQQLKIEELTILLKVQEPYYNYCEELTGSLKHVVVQDAEGLLLSNDEIVYGKFYDNVIIKNAPPFEKFEYMDALDLGLELTPILQISAIKNEDYQIIDPMLSLTLEQFTNRKFKTNILEDGSMINTLDIGPFDWACEDFAVCESDLQNSTTWISCGLQTKVNLKLMMVVLVKFNDVGYIIPTTMGSPILPTIKAAFETCSIIKVPKSATIDIDYDTDLGKLIETQRYIINADDFNLDDNVSTESESDLSDGEIENYLGENIKIGKQNTRIVTIIKHDDFYKSFMLNSVKNLPDLPLFLMRSYMGYTAMGWLFEAETVLSVLRIIYKVEKEQLWADLDAFEKITLKYFLKEIQYGVDCGQVLTDTFSYGDYTVKFENGRFTTAETHMFLTENRAKRFADKNNCDYYETEDGFVVTVEDEQGIDDEFLKSKSKAPILGDPFIKSICDIGADLGLFETYKFKSLKTRTKLTKQ